MFGAASALLALSISAADSTPKFDLERAIKTLAERANYSWRTTFVFPPDSPHHQGPNDGMIQKDGLTLLKLKFADGATRQAVLKGAGGALSSPGVGWQSLSELAGGPEAGFAPMLRAYKAPAAQATELVGYARNIQRENDCYATDLTEEGTLAFLKRGNRAVSKASASVRFWVKGKVLARYELRLKGTMSIRGNEAPLDCTIIVEIKDIGTTQVVVPAEALEKLAFSGSANPPPARATSQTRAFEEYVRFLGTQKQRPADYILGLFERYDLVVICERFHPEVTQYELLYELASDPRFQGQVGHIFTETGTTALRPTVESFLVEDRLSEEQVHERLRYIALNFSWCPVWEKTNIYDFLRKLAALNRSLPQPRRIHLYPSDVEFRWENATKESWAALNKQLAQRDQIMADNIIGKFKEIRQAPSRNKALVIMNYRHAFPHLVQPGVDQVENTAGFLMAAYPGRVANVMLNSVALLPGSTDHRAAFTALQDGKWDAAFATVGNPDLGFDFQNSPLGEDGFDYFPFIRTGLRYQEVFTGFVFFKPLEAHRMCSGLPGIYDRSFGDELRRRFLLTGDTVKPEEIESLAKADISASVYAESDCAAKIQRWLKAKP